MSGNVKTEQGQMTPGERDWYRKAGRRPFHEDGFTPQLMARIEEGAKGHSTGRGLLRPAVRYAGACLAAMVLLGMFFLPLGGWERENLSSKLSTILMPEHTAEEVSPASAAAPAVQDDIPKGSALFYIDGQRYYMPLPYDRDRSRALAVETSEGIVWSPPPPVVNYLKPKLKHNTEPYSLYLTPKGHAELSADTAQRIYTFPLYAGGANSYYELGWLTGVEDNIVMTYASYELGKTRSYKEPRLAVIDLKQVAAGEPAVPGVLWEFKKSNNPSLLAVNNEQEELLLVYYTDFKNNKKQIDASAIDMATGTVRKVSEVSEILYPSFEPIEIQYKVGQTEYTAETMLFAGREWSDGVFMP
ncbi:hypothetical protein [Paenibacillus tepidiphilus]|uniref:hypothetical protein n=1 Tax=Paenibacillus tepidiphilus TaxID=2608683 RepID=UPI00123B5CC3|nr:hypothetical protein [Paenibacillus tepidiphilus]